MPHPDPRASRRSAQEPDQAGQVELLLRAEASAEEEVAQAERAAHKSLEASRQRARHIAARADARIAALGLRAAHSVERRIETMVRESEARAKERLRPLEDTAHLEAAVRRVVDWLLGEEES